MTTIHNFQILNNGTQIGIDVETEEGYTIDSILLWTESTFKDYTSAVNLNQYLSQTDNRESLILNTSQIGIPTIQNIAFIEVTSTEPSGDDCSSCSNTVLSVAYELSQFYKCLINSLLSIQNNKCKDCDNLENKDFKMSILIDLLINTTIKSIDVGYFEYAISLIKELRTLCSFSKCDDCDKVECNNCNNFKQF